MGRLVRNAPPAQVWYDELCHVAGDGREPRRLDALAFVVEHVLHHGLDPGGFVYRDHRVRQRLGIEENEGRRVSEAPRNVGPCSPLLD